MGRKRIHPYDRIVQLRLEGNTYKAITALTGASSGSIREALKRNGQITPRQVRDWTPLLREYVEGVPTRTLSEKYGVTPAHIFSLAVRHGKAGRGRRRATGHYLAKLYRDGEGMDYLCAKYGTHETTLIRYINEAGFAYRPRITYTDRMANVSDSRLLAAWDKIIHGRCQYIECWDLGMSVQRFFRCMSSILGEDAYVTFHALIRANAVGQTNDTTTDSDKGPIPSV